MLSMSKIHLNISHNTKIEELVLANQLLEESMIK